MATQLTVNALTTTVRQRADQIGSSTFDDVTELKPWIRASLRQVQEMLSQYDNDWMTSRVPLSLHAGMGAYSLPGDARRLTQVFALYNFGANRIRLREFVGDDFGALNTPIYQNQPMQYRVVRTQIWIQPTPALDVFNALELVYVPEGRAPVTDYVPLDETLPAGCGEWIVLDVLQKMAIKTRLQNMDDILKSKGQIEARLARTFKNRSDTAPVMRDGNRFSPQPVGYSAPQGPLVWVSA